MGVISTPFIVVFGALIAIILVLLAIPLLAQSGVGGTNSANLTSTGSSFSSLLPYFGLLIGGGITLLAIQKGGKGF